MGIIRACNRRNFSWPFHVITSKSKIKEKKKINNNKKEREKKIGFEKKN